MLTLFHKHYACSSSLSAYVAVVFPLPIESMLLSMLLSLLFDDESLEKLGANLDQKGKKKKKSFQIVVLLHSLFAYMDVMQ